MDQKNNILINPKHLTQCHQYGYSKYPNLSRCLSMVENKCNYAGCDLNGPVLVDGVSYCTRHAHNILKNRFLSEYEKWNGIDSKPMNFLNALHRYLTLTYKGGILIEALTNSKIRDRGFGFEKIDDGFRFYIVRHKYAWSARQQENWEQLFEYSLSKNQFTLIEETRSVGLSQLVKNVAAAIINNDAYPGVKDINSNKYGLIKVISEHRNWLILIRYHSIDQAQICPWIMRLGLI